MQEASLGKITRKFFFKVLVWFLVIEILVGIAVIASFGSKVDGETTDDMVEVFTLVNTLVKSLIWVNIVACIIPPLFATRKIKKKFIINNDNKMKVFRNVAIILTIFAVLLIGTHWGIKGFIFGEASKSTGVTEQEAREGLKDIEKFTKEVGIEEEEVDVMKEFLSLSDIYVADGIVFLLMIGCEYFLIVKKEQKQIEESKEEK